MAVRNRKNIEFGGLGEARVAAYLLSRSYEIIERNWRIPAGEIDLIALHPDGTIVFVEVKSRATQAYGHPLEAITSVKARRMRKLALAWLATNGKLHRRFRIDAVAVIGTEHFTIDYRQGVA